MDGLTKSDDSSLEAGLRALVIEEAGVPPDTLVSAGTLLEDGLGLDSLARLSLGSLLEQEYGIEMTDEAFDGLRTFGDVCDLVRTHAAP